ncbi:hypothetical protein ABT324_30825 [Saccharopolyspora sp. NPDC000359]|uniref:hypothetical protein n=1 Tax=Saccharopolyspora sp. NPDC000359 TaxID=3154251 RepID=UPI003330647F
MSDRDSPEEGKEEGQMPTAPAPPPPTKVSRTTLHTRIRDDLTAAYKAYADENNTSYQLVIEDALREYLERRGRGPFRP